jgi:hypothetical protein
MEKRRIPKPGEIYNHFKDKLYQIITVAIHSETGEPMAVYQALYGDFKTYVRSLEMFLSEVDHVKYPEIKQKYRFELRLLSGDKLEDTFVQVENQIDSNVLEDETEQLIIKSNELFADRVSVVSKESTAEETVEGSVNAILLRFLDAESYSRKLDVITSNVKHLNDRLINDMAVSLDCAVDEGPLDQRIHGLINCLQAMCRFEDKRLR